MGFDEFGAPEDRRDDWKTPEHLIAKIEGFFGGSIDLDPCASGDPIDHFATENIYATSPAAADGLGLDHPWNLDHVCAYVNPPYSDMMRWAKKCATEAREAVEGEIIMLAPARTDTRWFTTCASSADAVCFYKGRIKFVGATAGAKFPSVLLYWGHRKKHFMTAFSDVGIVMEFVR